MKPLAQEPQSLAWLQMPYTTINEAASYLVESTDSVRRRLIPLEKHPDCAAGKIRFRWMNSSTGSRSFPRLVSEDVLAILPLPKPMSPAETAHV